MSILTQGSLATGYFAKAWHSDAFCAAGAVFDAGIKCRLRQALLCDGTWAQSEVADATSDVLALRIIKVPIDDLLTAWTQVRDIPMRPSIVNIFSTFYACSDCSCDSTWPFVAAGLNITFSA